MILRRSANLLVLGSCSLQRFKGRGEPLILLKFVCDNAKRRRITRWRFTRRIRKQIVIAPAAPQTKHLSNQTPACPDPASNSNPKRRRISFGHRQHHYDRHGFRRRFRGSSPGSAFDYGRRIRPQPAPGAAATAAGSSAAVPEPLPDVDGQLQQMPIKQRQHPVLPELLGDAEELQAG